MRARAGHTLMELMISLTVLAVVGGSTAALTAGAYSDKALSDGYVRDVETLRKAAGVVGKDIRMASSVEAEQDSLALTVADTKVRYTLEDGVLLRSDDAGTQPVGRRIATFAVSPEGSMYRVAFELEGRATGAANRARVSTTAAPRAAGGVR